MVALHQITLAPYATVAFGQTSAPTNFPAVEPNKTAVIAAAFIP